MGLAESFKKTDEIMLSQYEIAKLPYFQTFTYEERTAAKARIEYRCHLCNVIVFWTDVWDIEDAFMIPFSIVCSMCRQKHGDSFKAKKEKYFEKI